MIGLFDALQEDFFIRTFQIVMTHSTTFGCKARTKEGVKDFSFHVKESYLAGLDIFASQASPIFQYICQVRFQQEFRVTRKKNSYEKKTKEGKMKKRKLIW